MLDGFLRADAGQRPDLHLVLLLGIWWRGLTDAGAIAGMVTGGVLCGGAMVAGAVLGAAGTPSVAGAARRVDGAGSVRRDDPGVPGHEGPGAADHHPADDPAAHARNGRWRPNAERAGHGR